MQAHLGDQNLYVKVKLTSADKNYKRVVLQRSLTSPGEVVPLCSQGLHWASVHFALEPSLYLQGT